MDKENEEFSKEFEKAFSQFKGLPGYDLFLKDCLEMQTKHPEYEHLSDLPYVKAFHCVGWDDPGMLSIIMKMGSKIKVELFDRYTQSQKSGKVDDFVIGLIEEVTLYKVIANVLEAKMELIENPPPGARDTIHVV
jgi:hypothetical protein